MMRKNDKLCYVSGVLAAIRSSRSLGRRLAETDEHRTSGIERAERTLFSSNDNLWTTWSWRVKAMLPVLSAQLEYT